MTVPVVSVNALHFHMFQRFFLPPRPLHTVPATLLLYNLGSTHMARMMVKSNKPVINKNQDGVPQESPCSPNQVGKARHVKRSPKSHCFKRFSTITHARASMIVHAVHKTFHTSPPLTSFLFLKAASYTSLHELTTVFSRRPLAVRNGVRTATSWVHNALCFDISASNLTRTLDASTLRCLFHMLCLKSWLTGDNPRPLQRLPVNNPLLDTHPYSSTFTVQ